MQSVRNIKPDELAKSFGSKNAACLAKENTYYIPKEEYVKVNTPVNYVSYLRKVNMIPVSAPKSFKEITMKPQSQAQNTPCHNNVEQVSHPSQVSQAGAFSNTGNGCCSKGAYVSGNGVSRGLLYTGSGSKGPYLSSAAHLHDGYRAYPHVNYATGGAMAYSPASGSPSYYAGMYAANRSYASM